jgi:hypothetical protein
MSIARKRTELAEMTQPDTRRSGPHEASGRCILMLRVAVAHSVLHVAISCCTLCAACCMLHVAYPMLRAACCMLHVAYAMLHVACHTV